VSLGLAAVAAVAAAAATAIFQKWLMVEMLLLRVGSLRIVKVLRGLPVLPGAPVQQVRLAGPVVTASLFSSGTLLALAALIKEGPGRHIWHQATHVDISDQSAGQVGAVLNWDYFNAVE
jgi:hypothetical protein